jgi:hypothetical protein
MTFGDSGVFLAIVQSYDNKYSHAKYEQNLVLQEGVTHFPCDFGPLILPILLFKKQGNVSPGILQAGILATEYKSLVSPKRIPGI